ncbi:lipase member H isoform X2 [Lepeophtheirus salmonis]|uniref:lipase member H isoform X2 n=1 Tax=Lepeophtheirus salmonis TaxID=72036 RepID=UPI003AF3BB9A
MYLLRITRRRKLSVIGAFVILCFLFYLFWCFNSNIPFLSTFIKPILLFIKQSISVLREFEFKISRNIEDVKIILWTKNTTIHEFIFSEWNNIQLSESRFNPNYPIKIFFHGFSDNARTIWTKSFRDKYLSVKPYNVFSIDWELLALSPWYTTAAKNADSVGKYISKFVKFLVSQGVSYKDIHLLGASLGAHAAGYVGYYTQGKIGRITGLDPSGPLFHSSPHKDRLDPSDAVFVDIIHSAGKWVGNDDIMGHVDFFVNGGQAPQPLCINKESLDLSCSHFVVRFPYNRSRAALSYYRALCQTNCIVYKFQFGYGWPGILLHSLFFKIINCRGIFKKENI